MSFLDSLFTLENTLEEGDEVLRFPRTWRDSLPWDKKPFCYKAHQTKGGLYFVLPHDKDGSLFLDYPRKEFLDTKDFHLPRPAVGPFYAEQVLTKRDDYLSFASKVSRTVFNSETNTGVKISVSYGVTADAVPIGLHINYSLILHREDYKKVSFKVTRDRITGVISATGPHIKTNIHLPREELWLTDYDATLENLVDLITAEELTPEHFSPLLTDAYVVKHTLH
ncbi:hypothetical protein HY494_02440 [Candidatus Woesearchaeota archaeon]|nr:hypothetical protein [Candidatus Woesearchaeota archaeon]